MQKDKKMYMEKTSFLILNNIFLQIDQKHF